MNRSPLEGSVRRKLRISRKAHFSNNVRIIADVIATSVLVVTSVLECFVHPCG